jgi:hypothetical protein
MHVMSTKKPIPILDMLGLTDDEIDRMRDDPPEHSVPGRLNRLLKMSLDMSMARVTSRTAAMGGRWVVSADRYVGAAIEHFVMLPVDEQERLIDGFLQRYPGMTKPGLRAVRGSNMARPLDDDEPEDELKPKRKPGRPRKQGPGSDEK